MDNSGCDGPGTKAESSILEKLCREGGRPSGAPLERDGEKMGSVRDKPRTSTAASGQACCCDGNGKSMHPELSASSAASSQTKLRKGTDESGLARSSTGDREPGPWRPLTLTELSAQAKLCKEGTGPGCKESGADAEGPHLIDDCAGTARPT